MRFVEAPDAIPHRERNDIYHRISKRTLDLVLLSKAGDFKLNSKLRVVPNSEHRFREVTQPVLVRFGPLRLGVAVSMRSVP